MGKRQRQKQKTRYFTIRIQYYPIPSTILIIPISFLFLFIFIHLSLWVSLYQTFSFSMNENAREIILRSFPPEIPGYNNTITTAVTSLGEDTLPINHGGEVIFHGSRERKEVALTFDADMTPFMRQMLVNGQVKSYYNKQLIDFLTETHTKATLFLTGMWIELYPDVTRELASSQLFELGNHSYSHPSFDGPCFGLGKIPESEDQGQIQKTQFLLQIVAGVNGKLFRFPGGCYNQNAVAIVNNNGLKTIQWDVEGVDGFNNNEQSIVQNIMSRVKNGSIIVMHMNGYPNDPKTTDAVKEIIPKLKEEGYSFVQVSELLDSAGTQQAVDFHHLQSIYQ